MKRMRVVVGVGLLGVVSLTGCGKAGTDGKDEELRNYLGATGEMYTWEQRISKAVCNLENKGGITTGDFYCGVTPYPPSVTPPPKYPPGP